LAQPIIIRLSLSTIVFESCQALLLRDGQLIEVMPKWRLRTVNLWLVHLGNRFTQRSVRVFKEFAAQMVPKLFPGLPT
jgi:hypothetical protein